VITEFFFILLWVLAPYASSWALMGMEIQIIDTTASLPVELTHFDIISSVAPVVIVDAAKQQKIWHLIAWADNQSNSFGFYHKRKAVTFEKSEIKSVGISFMTRAKGQGWVALEVVLKNKEGIHPVFESKVFDEKAVPWLLKHKLIFEKLFGHQIEVNDYGGDY